MRDQDIANNFNHKYNIKSFNEDELINNNQLLKQLW